MLCVRPSRVSLFSAMLNRGEIPRPWYACNICYPQDFANFVYFGAIIMPNGTIFFSSWEKQSLLFQELFFELDCFVTFRANFIEILEIQ